MDLPTVLYRCPGPHSRGGGTYDYLGVETPEAHDKAMADGWHSTMPEAIADYESIKAGVIQEVEAEFKADVQPLPESFDVPTIKLRGKPGPKPKAKDAQ